MVLGEKKEIVLEAHRGGMGEFPENTLLAFEKAIELGINSVELDVWLSKDKELMIIHCTESGDISETTNGRGHINLHSRAELKEFDAGQGETIPTLEEVLLLCEDKILVNIELKDPNKEVAHKTFSLLKQLNYFDKCIVSSFVHPLLDEMNLLSKGLVKIGHLFEEDRFEALPEIKEMIDMKGDSVNIAFQDLSENLVLEIQKSGKKVLGYVTAATSNEEEWYEHVYFTGVDIMCVNYPTKLKNFLKNH